MWQTQVSQLFTCTYTFMKYANKYRWSYNYFVYLILPLLSTLSYMSFPYSFNQRMLWWSGCTLLKLVSNVKYDHLNSNTYYSVGFLSGRLTIVYSSKLNTMYSFICFWYIKEFTHLRSPILVEMLSVPLSTQSQDKDKINLFMKHKCKK